MAGDITHHSALTFLPLFLLNMKLKPSGQDLEQLSPVGHNSVAVSPVCPRVGTDPYPYIYFHLGVNKI
jgi:hypothetical protein